MRIFTLQQRQRLEEHRLPIESLPQTGFLPLGLLGNTPTLTANMDKMINIANLEVPSIQNAFEGLIDPSRFVKATNMQSLSVARLSEDIIKPTKLLRPYGNVTSLSIELISGLRGRRTSTRTSEVLQKNNRVDDGREGADNIEDNNEIDDDAGSWEHMEPRPPDESGQHWLSISIGYCNGCCGCPTTCFGAHSKTP